MITSTKLNLWTGNFFVKKYVVFITFPNQLMTFYLQRYFEFLHQQPFIGHQHSWKAYFEFLMNLTEFKCFDELLWSKKNWLKWSCLHRKVFQYASPVSEYFSHMLQNHPLFEWSKKSLGYWNSHLLYFHGNVSMKDRSQSNIDVHFHLQFQPVVL